MLRQKIQTLVGIQKLWALSRWWWEPPQGIEAGLGMQVGCGQNGISKMALVVTGLAELEDNLEAGRPGGMAFILHPRETRSPS